LAHDDSSLRLRENARELVVASPINLEEVNGWRWRYAGFGEPSMVTLAPDYRMLVRRGFIFAKTSTSWPLRDGQA
jgi:hypothetical protein